MQKIEVVVRRPIREAIRDALLACGAQFVTMTDQLGAPRSGSLAIQYRGASYKPEVPETKIEGVVADSDVPAVMRAIVDVARNEQSFDGQILVVPVREAISIAAACADRPVSAGARRRPLHLRLEA